MSTSTREPIVAGQFYEASPAACRAHIEQMLNELPALPAASELPSRIIAAMVPHAGWVFSGSLALLALQAIKAVGQNVDTFIIFGTMHRYPSRTSLIYDSGGWDTPLGAVNIDDNLTYNILEHCANQPDNPIETNKAAHDTEHSIEVQVPLIKYLFPDARIVPVMVPPLPVAITTGHLIATAIGNNANNQPEASDNNNSPATNNIVCLASTDLTHYGSSYGFTPQGTGPAALQWAFEENDLFFLDAALAMQPEKLLEIANNYGSACGAGAVAAAVTVARELGAASGYLLVHTSSAQIIEQKYHQPSDDSVGYAAAVWG